MRGKSRDEEVARLAGRQYGVLSRGQALMLGFSSGAIERRLKSGRWESVRNGVYRISGAPHWWQQSVMAACLWGGKGAAASHRTAAALWDLDGFRKGLPEITTPRALGSRHQGVRVHARVRLPKQDITILDAIPVTKPARTIVDLAAVVPREAVEQALDAALRTSKTSLREIRSKAEELAAPGRKGTALLRQVLADRVPGERPVESVLERKLLRVLKSRGLPRPTTQHLVYDRGVPVARLDFAYPAQKIGIEADATRSIPIVSTGSETELEAPGLPASAGFFSTPAGRR
jgi:hypothetical protein